MSSILVGVSGSAACFKAVQLCSDLTQAGHKVRAVLTPSAARFVTPLQFSCVCGRSALHDEWSPEDPGGMDHISLARAQLSPSLPPQTGEQSRFAMQSVLAMSRP